MNIGRSEITIPDQIALAYITYGAASGYYSCRKQLGRSVRDINALCGSSWVAITANQFQRAVG